MNCFYQDLVFRSFKWTFCSNIEKKKLKCGKLLESRNWRNVKTIENINKFASLWNVSEREFDRVTIFIYI